MIDLGYHPFPQPAAIASIPYNDRPACSYCGYCSGFGCWNDSKSSTLVTALRRAEETGRLDVRPHSRVMRITGDDAPIRSPGSSISMRLACSRCNRRRSSSSAPLSMRTLACCSSSSDFYPAGLANAPWTPRSVDYIRKPTLAAADCSPVSGSISFPAPAARPSPWTTSTVTTSITPGSASFVGPLLRRQ